MISLVEAQEIVIGGCKPVAPVNVDCQQMSGRVVAQDVVATEFIPPFDNTAVDGFAVRAQDVKTAGVELEVLGVIGAGHVASYEIGAGQSARIMTGAPMPRGADAVVMIEDATVLSPTRVQINKPARVGEAIRKIGEDVRAGDVVDIFVNSELAGAVVDEAITIKSKGVWLQLDVIDDQAVARANAAGLIAVMNRCPAIEYKKRA